MSESNAELPFQPIRNSLYSSMDLLAGFDPDRPDSAAETPDFRTYQYFTMNGSAAPSDPYVGMMEALHDNSIMRAMSSYLQTLNRPTVAIMGGHSESRDSANFADVVEIARRLTRRGCVVASGGGPGAMEATHLGALLAEASEQDVAEAIKSLTRVPKLPKSGSVVTADGAVDMTLVRQLHAWAAPAYQLAERYLDSGSESLAVPTWYYGHEPITPLATHVAKYFQNSIREDVLLALAANGIIYTAGAAGTLQEIFQDAAQNYYPKEGDSFAPMIFFGSDFWNNTLPVMPLLEALFVRRKGMSATQFAQNVGIVDSVDEAVDRLLGAQPSEAKTLTRMHALGLGQMMSSVH